MQESKWIYIRTSTKTNKNTYGTSGETMDSMTNVQTSVANGDECKNNKLSNGESRENIFRKRLVRYEGVATGYRCKWARRLSLKIGCA
jgi:hypothetical protein